MKKVFTLFVSLFILLTTAGVMSAMAAEKDKAGSKDHPLLSRMPNFHIYEYKDKEFDRYNFIDAGNKRRPIEGHYYYIRYLLDKGAPKPGELKIIRNIQNALTKVGGKVLFEGVRNSTIVIERDGRETWVEVLARSDEYTLQIVEKEAMKQEVVADAAAMGDGLRTTGHVSVYGIYFDTGKSDIKPESDAALSEIAKLLKNENGLNLYVVGHTDNVGSFESNMKLSKERADAVVKALSGTHGIAAARLKAHGVASLSPVATNDTEEGKAKNRRVELVKQ